MMHGQKNIKFLDSLVWWPYIHFVCWCCHYVGPVCTESVV